MWTLLPLLAAIGISYVIIRRLRLARERRERGQISEVVEDIFLRLSQEFSAQKVQDLIKTLHLKKRLRLKYLQPELSRLESALSTASRWTYEADPEAEQKAILDGVAHLYVKWRRVRPSVAG